MLRYVPDEDDDTAADLGDDDAADLTTCPRCGKSIWAYADQCHHCGTRFVGEAWQGKTVDANPRRMQMVLMIIALIAALLFATRFA